MINFSRLCGSNSRKNSKEYDILQKISRDVVNLFQLNASQNLALKNYLAGSLKIRFLSLILRDLDLVGLEQSLRIWISTKKPGDADAADLCLYFE